MSLSEREEEYEEGVSPPPCKRSAAEEEEEEDVGPLSERQDNLIHNTIPGTNIKITTRGETFSDRLSSLSVSDGWSVVYVNVL